MMLSDPFDLCRWYHELGVLGIGIHHRLRLLCVGILRWLRWRIVGTRGRRLFMTQATVAWWQLVRILLFNRGNVRFHRSGNKCSRKYSTARTLRNNRYPGFNDVIFFTGRAISVRPTSLRNSSTTRLLISSCTQEGSTDVGKAGFTICQRLIVASRASRCVVLRGSGTRRA